LLGSFAFADLEFDNSGKISAADHEQLNQKLLPEFLTESFLKTFFRLPTKLLDSLSEFARKIPPKINQIPSQIPQTFTHIRNPS
jgi:hypothetical protein